MPSPEDLIIGYLEELRGYEASGDAAGAKAVKAELKALGYDGKTPAQRAETRDRPASDVYPELKDPAWAGAEKKAAKELKG